MNTNIITNTTELLLAVGKLNYSPSVQEVEITLTTDTEENLPVILYEQHFPSSGSLLEFKAKKKTGEKCFLTVSSVDGSGSLLTPSTSTR